MNSSSRQFARLSRGLVRNGHWADLWDADRGASTSLLPVLALLSWGYQTAGARARLDQLQRYSGLSRRLVMRSFRTLQALRFADIDIGERSSTVSFRLLPRVFSSTDYFIMRRDLIDSAVWSGLTKSERSVAVAVASSLPAISWCHVMDEDVSATRSTDSDARGYPLLNVIGNAPLPRVISDWLWDQDAVVWHHNETAENKKGTYFKEAHYEAERIGMRSLSELATLTGLNRASISRAITRLNGARRKASRSYISDLVESMRLSEPTASHMMTHLEARPFWQPGIVVVASWGTADGHWFHTPDKWWGWAQYEELEMPDSGTSSTAHDPATSP